MNNNNKIILTLQLIYSIKDYGFPWTSFFLPIGLFGNLSYLLGENFFFLKKRHKMKGNFNKKNFALMMFVQKGHVMSLRKVISKNNILSSFSKLDSVLVKNYSFH